MIGHYTTELYPEFGLADTRALPFVGHGRRRDRSPFDFRVAATTEAYDVIQPMCVLWVLELTYGLNVVYV